MLLGYVDDATARLMQLPFVPTESTSAYFSATRADVDLHQLAKAGAAIAQLMHGRSSALAQLLRGQVGPKSV